MHCPPFHWDWSNSFLYDQLPTWKTLVWTLEEFPSVAPLPVWAHWVGLLTLILVALPLSIAILLAVLMPGLVWMWVGLQEVVELEFPLFLVLVFLFLVHWSILLIKVLLNSTCNGHCLASVLGLWLASHYLSANWSAQMNLLVRVNK